MPKSTFIKLEESKRKTFLDAAMKEFSLKGYHGASLTQLVKDLKIAKGSLYQYFEDKEEIYRFLVSEACARRAPFFTILEGKPREDYLFNYLIVSLKFDCTFPHIGTLIYNALTTFRAEITEIITQEFASRVPQNYLLPQIQLMTLACGNFIELLDSGRINLQELILRQASVTVESDELLRIVQRNSFKI